jgi:hypothetical protein
MDSIIPGKEWQEGLFERSCLTYAHVPRKASFENLVSKSAYVPLSCDKTFVRRYRSMFQVPLYIHNLTISNHATNDRDSQRGLPGCVVSSSLSALWDSSHPTMRPLRSCRPEGPTAVKHIKSPFAHNPLQTSQIISHVS